VAILQVALPLESVQGGENNTTTTTTANANQNEEVKTVGQVQVVAEAPPRVVRKSYISRLLHKRSSKALVINGSVVRSPVEGWRMAQSGFTKESAFFEVKLVAKEEGNHARVGWSVGRKANVEANVGFDEFSYGYRDLTGSRVTRGVVRDYGEAWQAGDVIGCALWQDIEGASIWFYKNGVNQGIAFEKLKLGDYSAAVSVFGKAELHLNFGPNFEHEPQDLPFKLEEVVAKKKKKAAPVVAPAVAAVVEEEPLLLETPSIESLIPMQKEEDPNAGGMTMMDQDGLEAAFQEQAALEPQLKKIKSEPSEADPVIESILESDGKLIQDFPTSAQFWKSE